MQLAENFIDMCLKHSMEFIERESQRSVSLLRLLLLLFGVSSSFNCLFNYLFTNVSPPNNLSNLPRGQLSSYLEKYL